MTKLNATTKKNKSWICDFDFFKQAKAIAKAREVKEKLQQSINSWSLYNANW